MRKLAAYIILFLCVFVLVSCKSDERYVRFDMNSELLEEIVSCEFPTVFEQDNDIWIIDCNHEVHVYNAKKDTYETIRTKFDDETSPRMVVRDGFIYFQRDSSVHKFNFSGEEVASREFEGDISFNVVGSTLLVEKLNLYSQWRTLFVLNADMDIQQQINDFRLEREHFSLTPRYAGVSGQTIYVLEDGEFVQIYTIAAGNEAEIEFVGDSVFVIEKVLFEYARLATKIHIYDGTETNEVYFESSFNYGFTCYLDRRYYCYSESYGEYEQMNYHHSVIVMDETGEELARIDSGDYQDTIEFITTGIYYVMDYDASTYTIYKTDGTLIDTLSIDDLDQGYYNIYYVQGILIIEHVQYGVEEHPWYRIDGDEWIEIIPDHNWYGMGDLSYTVKETGEAETVTSDGEIITTEEEDPQVEIAITGDQTKIVLEDRILVIDELHIIEYNLAGERKEEYEAIALFRPFDDDQYTFYMLVRYDDDDVAVKPLQSRVE